MRKLGEHDLNIRGIQSMLTDELLIYLFEEKPHPLRDSMSMWLEGSRRFVEFVQTFRDKIRKKLRVSSTPEASLDLRLELETAYLLLQERQLSVAYEPLPGRQIRSPDFGVTYTTSMTFMVEVTRLHGVFTGSMPAAEDRLIDVVCNKLGQFLPQYSNVLIIGVDELYMSDAALQTIMQRLPQRAQQHDSTFWQRYGFSDRAAFFQQHQRLSEVLVRAAQLRADPPPAAWINPQARLALPGKARAALYRSHLRKG